MPSTRRLVVYHLSNSRSQSVLWLLEELGVEYELKAHLRVNHRFAPAEFKKIHPLGKSPIITDGDVALAESGAVIDYIIDKYGQGRFKTSSEAEYLHNLYYSHYASGSLMPVLAMGLLFQLMGTHSPWYVRPLVAPITKQLYKRVVKPSLDDHNAMLESHLADKEWISGGANPTAADFDMLFPLELMIKLGEAGEYVSKYVDMARGRPAYKRAVEKGGTYDLDFK